MTPLMDPKRELLRHIVATIAYRGGKAVRGAPPAFAAFAASDKTRTPARILAHVGDLFDWALSIAKGKQAWQDSTPLAWDDEVARFFRTLGAFDAYLASNEALAAPAEQLFQGPLADALTHVGQLTMLRRLSGATMKSENYYRADIAPGRVGSEQTPPKREFD
jgi:hypothetical protein